MKIAFVSTRGIPNNYGGFEQFAEYISVGMAQRGHEVVVYSPKFHPYQESTYKGVRIKHIYSPETWMGSSVGSFFYDFASLRDALKKEDFDIIYEAGYTSIIPAYIWFNVKKRKTSNIHHEHGRIGEQAVEVQPDGETLSRLGREDGGEIQSLPDSRQHGYP